MTEGDEVQCMSVCVSDSSSLRPSYGPWGVNGCQSCCSDSLHLRAQPTHVIQMN